MARRQTEHFKSTWIIHTRKPWWAISKGNVMEEGFRENHARKDQIRLTMYTDAPCVNFTFSEIIILEKKLSSWFFFFWFFKSQSHKISQKFSTSEFGETIKQLTTCNCYPLYLKKAGNGQAKYCTKINFTYVILVLLL